MSKIDVESTPALFTEIAEWATVGREGVSIARFSGFNSEGRFLIVLDDTPQPVAALSTVGLSEDDVGAKIVVAFENGSVRCPIIIGRIQKNRTQVTDLTSKVDGERLVLRANREIELRCGDASIVLTRAGKVLIKGNFVLSRSRGANKIKGAFVDIN